MIDPKAPQSRRKFLNSLAAGALAGGATPKFLSTRERNHIHTLARQKHQSANDQIQLAVIGAGGMGMAAVETALSIPGVKLVAVADCFDGRLVAARENYG